MITVREELENGVKVYDVVEIKGTAERIWATYKSAQSADEYAEQLRRSDPAEAPPLDRRVNGTRTTGASSSEPSVRLHVPEWPFGTKKPDDYEAQCLEASIKYLKDLGGDEMEDDWLNDWSDDIDLGDEEQAERNDAVNSPAHYCQGNIECIEAIEAALGAEGFKAFLKGQIMKYTWRQGLKGEAKEDAAKANWYAKLLVDKYSTT